MRSSGQTELRDRPRGIDPADTGRTASGSEPEIAIGTRDDVPRSSARKQAGTEHVDHTARRDSSDRGTGPAAASISEPKIAVGAGRDIDQSSGRDPLTELGDRAIWGNSANCLWRRWLIDELIAIQKPDIAVRSGDDCFRLSTWVEASREPGDRGGCRSDTRHVERNDQSAREQKARRHATDTRLRRNRDPFRHTGSPAHGGFPAHTCLAV